MKRNARPLAPARAVVLALALALVACLGAPFAGVALAAGSGSDGILVTVGRPGEGGVSLLSDATSALEAAGVEVTGVVASGDGELTVEARPAEGQSDEEALAAAQALSGVTAAQLNYVYELIEPVAEDATGAGGGAGGVTTLSTLRDAIAANDPFAQVADPAQSPNQYWLYTTGLTDAWGASKAEGKVTVVTMDSGVKLDHPDLADNLLVGYAWDVTTDQPLSAKADPDPFGHGTHVAGIIAGVANNGIGIAGGSYNASVLPVNVISDETGRSNTATLAKAFQYVFDLIDSGALTNVHVCNMSLGAYSSDGSENYDDALLHDCVRTAREDYRIATVCAGGNGDSASEAYTTPLFPSDFEESVSVTALNADGTNIVYSDYNEAKDISAPGGRVWSTWVSYNSVADGYYTVQSGTSMAAPMVSATVALMFAAEPNATVDEVCEALYETADPVVDPEHDRTQPDEDGVASGSHGALDADEAVAWLVEHVTRFGDVSAGDWYYDDITYVAENGVMSGYADGSGLFGVADPIQRQDVALILYRLRGEGADARECGLDDVDQGEYYADAVNWCVANGVFTGYQDGSNRFGVGEDITREDLATVLYRLAGEQGGEIGEGLFYALPDHGLTSPYAVDAVQWALGAGVVSGREDLAGNKTLGPQLTASRAEVAAMLRRALTGGVL